MATSKKSFSKLLRLENAQFSNAPLESVLTSVYDWSAQLWLRPKMYDFVDHGIDHSYAVLQKALEISSKLGRPLGELSPLERLVLGIGALIHDVGMQYQQYPIPGAQKKTAVNVRRHHTQLGFEMVTDARDGKFHNLRGGPELALENRYGTFLHYGCVVAFAHSGDEYWKRLVRPDYAERTEGSQQILRLRYLAALIRLADELHVEYTRIPELNFIQSPLLDAEGRAHWAACYYTQEIRISSPGTGGLYMYMHWRVPENATDEDVDIIRTLLQDLRERKTNQEIQLVRQHLKLSDSGDPCFLEFKLEGDPLHCVIDPPPDEVRAFVREKLQPIRFGAQEPSPVNQLSASEKADGVRRHAEGFFLEGRGVESGHWGLRTGWHTDKYVRCRELCEDVTFVRKLVAALTQHYANSGITEVVAIGSSAIRVGSVLALALNAKSFSYTFADDSSSGEHQYLDYETDLSGPDGGNVLIVDDIVGVGSVLQEVAGRLTSRVMPPKRIEAFALYSLGDLKSFLSGLADVHVTCLASFPDVKYWHASPENGLCQECEKHPAILSRVE